MLFRGLTGIELFSIIVDDPIACNDGAGETKQRAWEPLNEGRGATRATAPSKPSTLLKQAIDKRSFTSEELL